MSIKERLEKAKERRAERKAEKEKQPKKTVGKKVAMAVLGGALTLGATSCRERNPKTFEVKHPESTLPQDNNTNDTIYVQVEGGTYTLVEEDGVTHSELDGFPMRKQAENPKDPDSLLVETEHTEYIGGNRTEVTPKYVPIDKKDRDKYFYVNSVITSGGEEVLETRDVVEKIPERYDSEGRHPAETRTSTDIVARGVKYKKNITYSIKNENMKASEADIDLSVTAAEKAGYDKKHCDKNITTKADKKIMNKIAKQRAAESRR